MRSLTPVLGLNPVSIGRFGGSPFGGPGAVIGGIASQTVVLPLVTSTQTIFDLTVTITGAATLLLEAADELLLESGDLMLVESGNATKLTALSAMTTPTTDDLVYVVDDPAGTPASNKLTMANLRTYLLA